MLALLWPLGAQTTQVPPDAPDNATAYTALHVMSKALGREALDRVVEVAGRDGAPQPRLWKIVLKEDTGSREVDVEDGKITAQRPLTRPPAYATPIHLSDLNLDSSGAFDASDGQARKVKLRFDSLNYVLRVNEATGKPVWHIELINKEGTGVGTIRVAAHDGTVLSTDGRLASNPPPVATPPSHPPAGGQHVASAGRDLDALSGQHPSGGHDHDYHDDHRAHPARRGQPNGRGR